MNKRTTLILYVFIFVLAVVLLYATFEKGHNWGGDFSCYIMQAKSLFSFSASDFIQQNSFAMNNSVIGLGPVAYPWGFPFLLAIVYAVFGLNIAAFKMVGIIFYLLFLVLFWFGFRKEHSPSFFICLVAVFALNPTMLAFTNNVLSDIPFLFFSTLSLILIKIIMVEKRCLVSEIWDPVLIGGVITASFFIRNNGIFLLSSIMIVQAFSGFQRILALKRRGDLLRGCFEGISFRSVMVFAMPYLVFVLLVLIYKLISPSVESIEAKYLFNLPEGMLKDQVRYYFTLPHEFFKGIPFHKKWYWLTIPLMFIGAIRRRRTDYPVLIYMILTVGVYMLWPFRQGLRFIFPIIPFYVSFVFSGIESFQRGRTIAHRRLRKVLCLLPVVVMTFYLAKTSIVQGYNNFTKQRKITEGPYTETAQEMFSFISKHTPNDSIILFFKPRVMSLMTGRRSIRIKSLAQFSQGEYLCLYRGDSTHIPPTAGVEEFILKKGGSIVYGNKDFRLYKLR